MSDPFDLSSTARRIVHARRLALVALLFGFLGLIYDALRPVEPLYRGTATIQMAIEAIEEASIVSAEALDRKDLETVERLNTLAATTPNTGLMRTLVVDNDLLNDKRLADLRGAADSEMSLARDLQSAVQVAVREGTHLVDIFVTHRSPELVVDLANWVARGMVQHDADRKFAAVQEPFTILTNEAHGLRVRLDQAEAALAAFRKKEGIAEPLEERWSQLSKRQEGLRLQQDEMDARIVQRERDLNVVAKLGETASLEQLHGVLSVYESREVVRLRNLISKHNKAFELIGEDQEKLLASHTKVATELRQRLDQEIKDAPSTLSSELERLKAEANGIQRISEQAEAEMLELVDREVEYNVLVRDVEARRSLYDSLLERVQVFDLTRGLSDFPLSIVQRAESSVDVSREKSRLRNLSWLCIIGAGCVFLFDFLWPASSETGGWRLKGEGKC